MTCESTRAIGGLVLRCDRPAYTHHERHWHKRADGTIVEWRERG